MKKSFKQARKQLKQRNLVHLSAPKSGAGKHSDRKRQSKQGYTKHKGNMYEAARIPRKANQPAKSDKHSDLYTDEEPRGTITGLKFATTQDAEQSIRKIKSSGRTHAHKIQAAIAMEQRAKVAGKSTAASVYRKFINQMKEKTKKMNEEAPTIGGVKMKKLGKSKPGGYKGKKTGNNELVRKGNFIKNVIAK